MVADAYWQSKGADGKPGLVTSRLRDPFIFSSLVFRVSCGVFKTRNEFEKEVATTETYREKQPIVTQCVVTTALAHKVVVGVVLYTARVAWDVDAQTFTALNALPCGKGLSQKGLLFMMRTQPRAGIVNRQMPREIKPWG